MPPGGCTLFCLIPFLLNASFGSKLCPTDCLCYESSALVDCQTRGLGRVPHSIPHSTWMLDLVGNRLTEVRSRSFVGLWSLRILLMSNNSIQTLQLQAFSSLHFLERLDLSFNRLRWLPQDFSQTLSSLQQLRLDHNLLQHLDSASLADFESLRKLDLSSNRIRVIDVRAFSSLSLLSHLNLKGNRLDVLRDGLLGRQQSLERLLLGHNNISVIETEALAPLRSLTLLDLQGNQLERVRFKTLLKLQTTTTHLLLSSNPWICDCELQRVFSKIQHVRRLRVYDYGDIVCHAPPLQAGSSLVSLDSQLCVAETASVLVITITVLLAVIGALVKAEHNRKNNQAVSDTESDKDEK